MNDSLENALEQRLLARSQVSSRDVEALRLFARTLPARRRFWRGSAIQGALSAAAVVIAAAIVLPMLFRVPGVGTETPAPATASPVPTLPVETPVPTPVPTTAPPSATPRPTIPPLEVEGGGLDGLVIDNSDGLISGAGAGRGGFMSMRWLESTVEQVSPTRIRVTWAAYPDESIVDVKVAQTPSGGVAITVYERLPLPATDAEGEDRILLLEFDRPVDANDVEVSIESPRPPAN